jgi:hypothetical protein
LGDFQERQSTAKDAQGQNKQHSSAKFPPSLATLGGRISTHFLKRDHCLFSYSDGECEPSPKSVFSLPGNCHVVQIVEKA